MKSPRQNQKKPQKIQMHKGFLTKQWVCGSVLMYTSINRFPFLFVTGYLWVYIIFEGWVSVKLNLFFHVYITKDSFPIKTSANLIKGFQICRYTPTQGQIRWLLSAVLNISLVHNVNIPRTTDKNIIGLVWPVRL